MKQLSRIVLAVLVSAMLIACEVSEPAATPSPATIAPAAPTVLLTAPPADSLPTPTPAAYVPPPTPYPAP
jgi:hypothetical protein